MQSPDNKTRQQTAPYVPDPETPATAPERTEPLAFDGGLRFGPAATPGEIGTLGRFRIKKELGRGGMGAVFLALDTRLERQVALKVMLPQAAVNQTAKDRFIREARAAARINHDNVISILDADEIDGVPFIALPFLQGYPLDQYLKKKGSLSTGQVLRIGREIALGLGAAHDLGIVHRDVKPGNIWLEAPNGRVKILEFGLAKPQDEEAGGKELTHSGAVMGTPAYMAPEQAAGQKVDHRADLYSLGTVLYRLVAGKTPFERPGGMMALLTALAIEPPQRVEEFKGDVPPALAELIHQLLEKNRDQRPQSAKEVAKRLVAIRDNPAASGPDVSLAPVMPAAQLQVPSYVPVPVTMAPASAFADLDVNESTERESRIKEVEPTAPALRNRLPFFAAIGAGLLAITLGGYFVAKMLGGSSKPPDVVEKKPAEKPDPPKTTGFIPPKVVPQGARVAPLPKYDPWVPVSDLTPVNVAPRGPLDELDPAKIPTAERFLWQPRELVAVVGSHVGNPESHYRFFPDGKRFAALTHDVGLKVFETDTLKLLHWVHSDREIDGGWSLAVSPDGHNAAACVQFRQGGGGGIQIYDARGPTLVSLRRIAIGGVYYDMEFVDSGRTLVTLDPDIGKGIRQWNVADSADPGKPLVTAAADEKLVAMSLSSDGKSIAALCEASDRTLQVCVWDLAANGAKERCRLAPGFSTRTFSLSADGRRLMTASPGKLKLWDVSGSAPNELESIDDPRGWIRMWRSDRTKNECYLLSERGETEVWSFENKLQKVRDLSRNTVAVSPNGGRSLHNDDSSVHKVRDATGNVIATSGEAVAAASGSPALGNSLMTFIPFDKARLWTARDGAFQPEAPKAVRGNTLNPFTRATASPDGLAVAGLDYSRIVAFKVIGASLWPLTHSTHGNVLQFAWSPDSKSILLVNDQNVLYRWNPHDTDSVGEKILDIGYGLQPRIGQLQVAPNGKLVALAGPRGVELIDITDPKNPRRTLVDLGPEFQPVNLGAIAFSAGNRFLFVPGTAGLLRVDLTSANLQTDLAATSPISGFSAVIVSPDGRRIVTSGNYQFGGIEWWDATEFPFKRMGVYSCAAPANLGFAPDGRHFFLEQHGTVYILRLDGSIRTAYVPPAPPAPAVTTEPVKPAPAPKASVQWTELTDGKTLTVWDQFQTSGWTLKSNMLEADGTAQGWVGTKKEYEDFELEFEYRLPPNGNSGVFLRAWDNGLPTGAEFVEIQLLADAGYPNLQPVQRNGAVFKKVAPKPIPPFNLNQWNKARIEVVGKHVTVTIGGVKCVDADVEFPRMKGRVGLQHFRTSVEFRNVRIREK